MTNRKKLGAELLADPETQAERERPRPRYEFASTLIALRKAFGLSQRDLATLAGMTQPEIARLEAGKVSPTWNTAMNLFRAVDARIEVKVKRRGRLVAI
jgi:DNA-binding XRE family transcriptional regulator